MEPHGFLQQALVYLAAGVIAVPLCKRLGLGSVLGYLVVIRLVFVVGLMGGEAEMLRWAEGAKAIGIIALLIVAGGLLVRPVLRYVAEPRLREVFVGFTLLLVLGTAALMAWVGLSMA